MNLCHYREFQQKLVFEHTFEFYINNKTFIWLKNPLLMNSGYLKFSVHVVVVISAYPRLVYLINKHCYIFFFFSIC